jgi:hypothetical protein
MLWTPYGCECLGSSGVRGPNAARWVDGRVLLCCSDIVLKRVGNVSRQHWNVYNGSNCHS